LARCNLIPQFSAVFHLIRFFRRQLMLTPMAHVGHDGPMEQTCFGRLLLRPLRLLALLAALAWAAAGPAAAAPPPFEDTIAQRAMACTACHGRRAAPRLTAITRAWPASRPATSTTSCSTFATGAATTAS
jgi:hypothetical protein